MDATAWATVGLVVVTALLVYVTWRLEVVTTKTAAATEQSAAATRDAAEATRDQAVLGREAVQAQMTPLLIPISLEHDWLGRPLRPTWQPVAWPVVYWANEETPVVEMMLRNDGTGSALITTVNLHGTMVSWEGEVDRRVLPAGDSVRLRFHLRHRDPANPQEVMHRDRATAGEFTVAVGCTDVLALRRFETRVVTSTPQLQGVSATHLRQGYQVREGERFVMPLLQVDAYLQDNPESRGTAWDPQ